MQGNSEVAAASLAASSPDNTFTQSTGSKDEDVERKLLQLESRISMLEAVEESRSSGPLSELDRCRAVTAELQLHLQAHLQAISNSAHGSDVHDLKKELKEVRNLATVPLPEVGGLTECTEEVRNLATVPLPEVGGLTGCTEEALEIKKRLSRVEQCLLEVAGDALAAQRNPTANLQQLLHSIRLLEQQVSSIQRQMPHSNQEASSMQPSHHERSCQSNRTIDTTQSTPAGEVRRTILDQLEYKFETSVWDLSLFIGTDILSPATSVVVSLSLIFNVVLLICFIDMCFSLARSDFDEKSRHEFHIWRTTVAHNIQFKNSITGESLAHGVCTERKYNPIASHQLAIVLQLRDYLEDPPFLNFGVPKGVWMCWLSIGVWYLTLTAELREIGDLCGCFMGLPLSPGKTKFERCSKKPNRVCLVSVSYRRLVILSIIVGIRFAVMVLLGYIGTLYLCYEISIEDMILNSVALELMLNFDEMLFDAILPAVPQTVIRLVTPLPKKRLRMPRLSKHWNRYGIFIAILFIYAVLFGCAHKLLLQPFVENLWANLGALCGAPDLYDFVVTVDAIGIPWVASTPSLFSVEDQYAYHAMKETLNLDVSPFHESLQPNQRSNTGLFMQVESGIRLQRLTSLMPEFWLPTEWSMVNPYDVAETVGWEDEFMVLGSTDFGDVPGTVYNHYLQFLLGVPNSGKVNCSQVPFGECTKQGTAIEHVVMKQLCPSRCGCDSPAAGTVANPHSPNSEVGFLGCAAWNTRKMTFVAALDNLPCTDTTSLDIFVSWASGMGEAQVKGVAVADYLLHMFRDGGCAEVATSRMGISDTSRVCAATSLSAICPESCGCNQSISWTTHHTLNMEFCPFSCQRKQRLCVTVDKHHDYETGARGPFPGYACVFPFKYKGFTYHNCTSIDWTGPWCSIALRKGMNYRWGDCPDSSACR